MKKITLFGIAIFAMYACSQSGTTSQNNKTETATVIEEQDTAQIMIEATPLEEEKSDNKYLITNSSIGLFSIGSDFGKVYHDYDYNKTIGEECVDACCFGTTIFWKPNESQENPSIILYCKEYEDTETPEMQKMDCEEYSKTFASRSDLFFVCSDNCPSWYYTNRFTSFAVYSSDFKTEENIGVGSSVEDFLKSFDKVYMTVGWVEEDADAIQLSVDKYPNLVFIVNSDSFDVDWMPAEGDKIGDEDNYKILLHNTSCFTGKAEIRKICWR